MVIFFFTGSTNPSIGEHDGRHGGLGYVRNCHGEEVVEIRYPSRPDPTRPDQTRQILDPSYLSDQVDFCLVLGCLVRLCRPGPGSWRLRQPCSVRPRLRLQASVSQWARRWLLLAVPVARLRLLPCPGTGDLRCGDRVETASPALRLWLLRPTSASRLRLRALTCRPRAAGRPGMRGWCPAGCRARGRDTWPCRPVGSRSGLVDRSWRASGSRRATRRWSWSRAVLSGRRAAPRHRSGATRPGARNCTSCSRRRTCQRWPALPAPDGRTCQPDRISGRANRRPSRTTGRRLHLGGAPVRRGRVGSRPPCADAPSRCPSSAAGVGNPARRRRACTP